MSLWKIAWRSIQQRGLASLLTAVSMALGISLVVMVLVVHHVIDQSFRRSAQGFDLLVGAKGGRLELVLSTVYHLGRPPGTIPLSYYQELSEGRMAGGVEVAIPICLGDNYLGFPLVGTVPERFTKLQYLEGQNYRFAVGRNFDPEHDDEAVIGAAVAEKTDLALDKTFRPTHGLTERGADAHQHGALKVVGVLARTGTPVDRAIFINLDAFYHMEGHESQRLTAVLLCVKPQAVMSLAARIDREPIAQAVKPGQEISSLLEGLLGNIQIILLLLAVMVVIVAGIGMLVSIYNSMSERRHDIAIMRALGARRRTVMLVVLLESILLSLAGGALGAALGHGVIGVLSPLIAGQTGLPIEPWQFQANELILLPALVLLAAAIGYLPALVAYRTDVAKSLAQT
jgi:putative ABC transport system permease protein